jgi:hypothetical protein
VEFRKCLAHLTERHSSCLDDQEPFTSLFHLALPAVDRSDLWNDIDAGCEAALYQKARNLPSFFFRSSGCENDSFVGHIKISLQFSADNGTAKLRREHSNIQRLRGVCFHANADQVWHIGLAVAEEFTFANVRRAVGGIARYVAAQKPQRAIRIPGRNFCSMATGILAATGITPVLVAEPASTPAFRRAIGGAM